jgi:hypothetical protein
MRRTCYTWTTPIIAQREEVDALQVTQKLNEVGIPSEIDGREREGGHARRPRRADLPMPRF